MKELEYPFDNGFIMKKKRSLKRQLLGDGAVRLKKRVAVLGGSTTDDIVSVLELFLLDMGFECEFYRSEYGQFWQDSRNALSLHPKPEKACQAQRSTPALSPLHPTWG